jgi:hypothetical protein
MRSVLASCEKPIIVYLYGVAKGGKMDVACAPLKSEKGYLPYLGRAGVGVGTMSSKHHLPHSKNSTILSTLIKSGFQGVQFVDHM